MTATTKANIKKFVFLGAVFGLRTVFQNVTGAGYAKDQITGSRSSDIPIAGLEGFNALAGTKEVAIRLD